MITGVSSNMEDYLEAIHLLEKERGHVRVKDIAKKLNISCASVSGAIKNLKNKGLVSHSRYELVALTENGEELARRVYERHRVILRFLKDILKLDSETAEKDACRIEHSLSPATFERLRDFVEKAGSV